MSKDTVNSYIDLLEKAFVLFRLHGFSRNLRKEVTRMNKIYFYDLGIRNSLIDNHKPLSHRNDIGRLWENFLVLERRKTLSYTGTYTHPYFWRTYTGAELDYVEEYDDRIDGYGFKMKSRRSEAPKTWREVYPESTWREVTRDTYLKFLLPGGTTR